MKGEGKSEGKIVNVNQQEALGAQRSSLSDEEKDEHGVGTTVQLQRRLQSRHLSMIGWYSRSREPSRSGITN